MSERLAKMEDRMEQLKELEEDLDNQAKILIFPKSIYMKALNTAKKQLAQRKLAKTKDIITRFVERVTIYKDHITISFNFEGAAGTKRLILKKPQKITRQSNYSTVSNDSSINTKIDTINGGEGGI